MEVVMEIATTTTVPPQGEFNFDSNCSSPYITAPSSPQRFNTNLFFSAPTSPTRISPLFNWDQTPGIILKHDHHHHDSNDNDFAFDFSGNLQTTSLSTADDLFHAGKILPLKLPPPPISKNTAEENSGDTIKEADRGRERVPFTGSGRKGSRSLSPLRVSDVVSCDADDSVSSSTSNAKSFLSFTRKWRLRNFLLFRSASEGRAVENDPLMRKYTVLSKKVDDDDDVRNSTSFRSSESSTSGSVSRRQQQQRRGPVSAHELHYTLNRAATEEMKKKTFLPYKQGLLGCLGFNPQIPRGIASFTRS